MKRYLSLLLCLMLALTCFAACSKETPVEEPGEESTEEVREAEQITEVDDKKLEKAGDTLEARLSLLEKDGWEEKDGAYVFSSDEDGCIGEYSITAKENDADLTVSFDYGDDNAEMVDYFKEDPGAGQAICAYWYLRAVAVLDAPLGSVNYKMNVGDTEVVNGSMSYDDAEAIYDEYYED